MAHIACGNLRDAEHCIETALETLSGDRNRQARVNALAAQTLLYARSHDPTACRESAQAVMDLATQFGDIEQAIAAVCRALAEDGDLQAAASLTEPLTVRSVELRMFLQAALVQVE